ncbi:MAG: diphosphate--fructose-6-phosphate 1-phosphotransferase [Hallerella porci]|uniref:Pyrophosphate--fructose 6-phosphate 1-phosphotransferase n=1 Tax=Hallerella porci TaxID=1945871 RepID=A0ABX5LNN6_9BACT|nr:diphosphate--fructose-6-phosphate 1-phosphotransferase [Hallerella porci]MDY3921079.1 diphosphate--fructose-6-phosphate 1-phosphotransferase [Hallerella porci]PWL04024.1 pyrophosphate--fructose-6-phosphate 1-phosphotransferase [Hallerella porci]
MSDNLSVLGKARKAYQPKLPVALREGALNVKLNKGKPTESVRDQKKIKALFPNTYGAPYVSFKAGKAAGAAKPINVGVVLSGGQAPGGHNVIAGIFDGIKSIHKNSKLLGFLGGPSGLENGKFIVIDAKKMDAYRNAGGFDIIQSGRTKLETEEQWQKCLKVANDQKLDAIVIIGGDDSNTNAAVLGEYFQSQKAKCVVCGCPKTIDGDLKNEYIETSFGFDTAVKTYSELIGNIMRDANSAQKYWHFIKLMGRSASHIALEASLQTHPNITLISEEVKAKKMKLKQVIKYVADIVAARAAAGKNFGVCLIPEGLLEFIPDVGVLISELSEALAHHEAEVEGLDTAAKVEKLSQWVSKSSAEVLVSLPAFVQAQLMLERDSHGNVQVSLIETEKLIIEMVKKDLKSRKNFKGKFSALNHFFGYEGRCAAPSNFDADYCYSLGYTAAVLANNKMNGYMSSVRDLTKGADKWVAGGIPITMMMNMERRHGEDKPVIQKALVELDAAPFKYLAKNREEWAKTESYSYPGPIQYWGPSEVADQMTYTIRLERGAKIK